MRMILLICSDVFICWVKNCCHFFFLLKLCASQVQKNFSLFKKVLTVFLFFAEGDKKGTVLSRIVKNVILHFSGVPIFSAYYESSMWAARQNKETLDLVKKENKELREALTLLQKVFVSPHFSFFHFCRRFRSVGARQSVRREE